jgi:hypothetical protein
VKFYITSGFRVSQADFGLYQLVVCVHYKLVGIELQRNPFEFLPLPNSAAKAAVGELPPSLPRAPRRGMSCRRRPRAPRPRAPRHPRAGAAGPERRFASTSCHRRPRAPRRTSTSCRRPRASRRPVAAVVPERRAVYELLSLSRAPRVHELMNRPQAARYPHQICLLLLFMHIRS